MVIYIDGDACPVTDIVVETASRYDLRIVLIHSTSHFGSASKYQQVEKIMVDNESQAADMAIINRVSPGDVVVTGDYGLASLVLGKGVSAISFSGRIYDDENIEQLLFERHISAEARRSGAKVKGPSKRTTEDNERFRFALGRLLSRQISIEE